MTNDRLQELQKQLAEKIAEAENDQTTPSAEWQPDIIDPDNNTTLTPDQFWEQTPWLRTVRQAAEHTDAAPPFAVLAALLTHIGALMHPSIRISLGDDHPPTSYTLLVGPPGTGKTAATNAARKLLGHHADHVTEISPSSGEGVLASIIGKQPIPDPDSECDTESTTIAPNQTCLLYTSPSPRDRQKSRMPSSA